VDDSKVVIERDADVLVARQTGRRLASELSFTTGELALITTAISEITRNIVSYAERGEVCFRIVHEGARRGFEVVARDEGPGIENIELAMRDGYSTAKSLGLGLPGAKRIMDEFEIASVVGKGTTVTMRKWER
jgi:serine/threonine-protein kinase RsbT